MAWCAAEVSEDVATTNAGLCASGARIPSIGVGPGEVKALRDGDVAAASLAVGAGLRATGAVGLQGHAGHVVVRVERARKFDASLAIMAGSAW